MELLCTQQTSTPSCLTSETMFSKKTLLNILHSVCALGRRSQLNESTSLICFLDVTYHQGATRLLLLACNLPRPSAIAEQAAWDIPASSPHACYMPLTTAMHPAFFSHLPSSCHLPPGI